jgi:hypothetical protein
MFEKMQRLIQIERKRYEKKGIVNSLIAVTILLGLMWVSVTVGKIYWPEHVENKLQFVFVGSVFCHFSFQLISFLIHLPGYLGWSSYFAKHLINKKSSRPW